MLIRHDILTFSLLSFISFVCAVFCFFHRRRGPGWDVRMGPFSLTFTEVKFLLFDRSGAPQRAVFARPGTRRPRRKSMTPLRENQRFLVMFVPDLGMFVTFVLRSLIQAYPRSSRPRSAQRKTPPSASTSDRNQPKTSNHENVTSQTFLQNRGARPRHRPRTQPCR